MNSIEQLLGDIEKQIASVQDEGEREAARLRIKNLWTRYSGDDRIVTMREVVEADQANSQKLRSYSTGFGSLSDIIVNFRDTELITITGPTKNGKTTFAMSLTRNFLDAGHIPCWFSYEMTPTEFAEKIGGSSLPFIYTPRQLKTDSSDWVEKRIIEAIAKYNAQIFFIDHLHYISDIGSDAKENTSVRIGRTLRKLKRMAVDWNVTIFLIAHTKKIPPNETPTVSSLRDSSFISQESNTVIYVQRQGEETNLSNFMTVSVLANRRNGQNGSVDLKYNAVTQRLDEVYA